MFEKEAEEKSNNLRFENESGNDKTHEAMYTESKVLNAMKLLKASCEGKTLQTPNGKGGWIDCNTENIIFYDLLRFEYRIKEEDEMKNDARENRKKWIDEQHIIKEFKKELESLLNRYGWDNACETPDHILADYVEMSLINYSDIMCQNIDWHSSWKRLGEENNGACHITSKISNNETNIQEESEEHWWYVILNMNCQYEICHNCPKSGIFKGTREECEAFIEGTKCSNEHNAEFCYIVELVDTVNTTKDSYGDYSVQTNKAILYRGSKSKCEAFKKGIDYELKGRIKMEEKSNNLRLGNDEPLVSPSSIKTNDVTGYMHCDDENLNNEQLFWFPYHSHDEELRNNLKSVIASGMDIDEKVNIIIALCR